VVFPISLASQNKKNIFTQPQVSFTENKGQVADMSGNLRNDILFQGSDKHCKIYLRNSGISYVIGKTQYKNELESDPDSAIVNLHRIDLEFKNANKTNVVSTDGISNSYTNYYLAHCPDGISNVRTYNKITYHDIYNNIDASFFGNSEGILKYDFIVKPGGDPDNIELKYTGATSISIAEKKLKLETSIGDITEYMPEIFQVINNKKVNIKGEYILNNNIVKIKVEAYDKNFPLIIDPWITYYGGIDDEFGKGIKTDSQGNVLVTGMTYSNNFPTSTGAFQTVKGATSDVYIVKFNSMGVRQWATLFGGNNAELGWCIATDNNDNAVVTGYTVSSNFPTTVTAFQPALNVGVSSDVFVLKLNSAGNRVWATYYGGEHYDGADGICTDLNNNIFIAGSTRSLTFPVTTGAYQTNNAGNNDVFVAKFDPNGTPIWSTYYGGTNDEYARMLKADALGNVGVVGQANTNFPVTAGAYQAASAGSTDAFVMKFDPNGNPLWATYYGGNNLDDGAAIATDQNNNFIIAGQTNSNNLPATAGTFQPAYAAASDAFVAKFNSSGNVSWTTYYGGVSQDFGYGIAVDNNDNIFVSGSTYGIDFPVTTCAYQTANSGASAVFDREDSFIFKLDPSGQQLCATYLGGFKHDEEDGGRQIAVSGNYVYLTGQTPGSFPVTSGAQQVSYGGGQFDAFVAQFCGITCGAYPTALDIIQDQTNFCLGDQLSFTSSVISCDNTGQSFAWTFPGATPSSSSMQNPTGIVYNSLGTYNIKLVVTTPCGKDSITQTITADKVCKDIFIPNVFSPNSDGQNEIFYIYGKGIKTFSFMIFNRWGEKIFENDDLSKGWDGTFKSQKVNSGIYAYTFNAITLDGETIQRKGNITLIR